MKNALILASVAGVAFLAVRKAMELKSFVNALHVELQHVGVSLKNLKPSVKYTAAVRNPENVSVPLEYVFVTIYKRVNGIWESVATSSPSAGQIIIKPQGDTKIRGEITIPAITAVKEMFSALKEPAEYRLNVKIKAFGLVVEDNTDFKA